MFSAAWIREDIAHALQITNVVSCAVALTCLRMLTLVRSTAFAEMRMHRQLAVALTAAALLKCMSDMLQWLAPSVPQCPGCDNAQRADRAHLHHHQNAETH